MLKVALVHVISHALAAWHQHPIDDFWSVLCFLSIEELSFCVFIVMLYSSPHLSDKLETRPPWKVLQTLGLGCFGRSASDELSSVGKQLANNQSALYEQIGHKVSYLQEFGFENTGACSHLDECRKRAEMLLKPNFAKHDEKRLHLIELREMEKEFHELVTISLSKLTVEDGQTHQTNEFKKDFERHRREGIEQVKTAVSLLEVQALLTELSQKLSDAEHLGAQTVSATKQAISGENKCFCCLDSLGCGSCLGCSPKDTKARETLALQSIKKKSAYADCDNKANDLIDELDCLDLGVYVHKTIGIDQKAMAERVQLALLKVRPPSIRVCLEPTFCCVCLPGA